MVDGYGPRRTHRTWRVSDVGSLSRLPLENLTYHERDGIDAIEDAVQNA